MIILGIDPGETLIGIGIIKKTGSDLELVHYGCINIDSKLKTEEKLFEINKQLSLIIKKYKPDIIGIEELFFFKNKKTIIKVAQARGVLLFSCKNNNIKIMEFTPLQIKQAVTCYGRAEKKQVQLMVSSILKLDKIPKPDDAADALAVAITTANTNENLIKNHHHQTP